jgi:hypothetical protein
MQQPGHATVAGPKTFSQFAPAHAREVALDKRLDLLGAQPVAQLPLLGHVPTRGCWWRLRQALPIGNLSRNFPQVGDQSGVQLEIGEGHRNSDLFLPGFWGYGVVCCMPANGGLVGASGPRPLPFCGWPVRGILVSSGVVTVGVGGS